MTRAIFTALAMLLFAADAGAQEYVTGRDRLMCKTQQSLREAIKAIDAKDRQTLSTVQGCHRTIDGVRAEVIQDNMSMVKIRVGDADQADRQEFWTLPDSIKPASRR
jgi:uncharacterized protein YlxW (UPF0749 family)